MDAQERQSFGRLLRRHRETAGLSQSELAERAGITPNAIGMLERGERRHPQPYTIRQLADALGLEDQERARLIAAASASTEPATQHTAGSESERQRQSQGEIGTSSDLPAPLTRLVGRGREVAAVRRLLAEARLVTLTGVGGTGKTRLAIEVARQSRDAFPGGTRFVNLAPIDDPEIVPLAIERRLRAEQAPGASPLERIASLLRDECVLLVLDNLEQVVEAGPVISALLASAPNLRVLATSRVVLHLYGEHEYRVPPLSLAGEDEARQAEHAEAVQLFVQAARAARPDFAVDEATLATVAEICRRLDGLPLAIELAAARTRFFSPKELLARLTHRLEPLTGGGRDVPERQQTLRRTFDWSYDLLTSDQRRLLARLGVFAGSFSPSDAAAVVGGTSRTDDAFDALTDLFESGLLERASGSRGELRFALLQTVREYALARLAETGELAATLARHASHYLELAEEAAPELTGPNQAAWLRRLELDRDNLWAVLQWALEGAEAEIMLRLAAALGRYWELSWHLDEGRSWLERSLAMAQPPRVEAIKDRLEALFSLARIALNQGDRSAAHERLTEGLSLARAVDSSRWISAMLSQLGFMAYIDGNYAKAQAYHQEALALRRERGNPRDIALSLVFLGRCAFGVGDYEAARGYYEEGTALMHQAGDWRELDGILPELGRVYVEMGDSERARALYDECVAPSRRPKASRPQPQGIVRLGALAWLLGKHHDALEHYRTSLERFRDAGNRHRIAGCLAGIGAALVELGKPVLGVRLLAAADKLRAASEAATGRTDYVLCERACTAARVELGEPSFTAAWASGQTLTTEQAIHEALNRALD